MRSNPLRTVLAVVVFVVFLAGALVLLRTSEPASSGGSGDPDPTAAPTTGIWEVGDAWTVQVRQDAGAISPDGDANVASVPFRFEVVTAPKGADDMWIVDVTQDGAEGPFAGGWHLQYASEGDELVLKRVSVGDEPPLEAELASIVLGSQFPYEVSYSAPPKDKTMDAKQLLERSALPPSALPGSDAPDAGVAPPAQAPKLDAGGAPRGAPATQG